jgi:serine protease Do
MSSVTPGRSRRARVLLAALMSTTIIGGSAAAWSLGSRADAATEPLKLAPATVTNAAGFADLVAKARPAVVSIATTGRFEAAGSSQMPAFPPGSALDELFRRFLDGGPDSSRARPDGPTARALGSGFIIDASGYIVTNNHVVDGASKIVVTLDDGSSFPATVKGRDEKTDLALLKIDAGKPLPYVTLGDSDQVRVGDWVIAVGDSFGLGGTVTAGIVSAHGRDLNSGPYDDFLQIDAPINPGNSGGPVFDQSGHVIGVDTAIYSPNGGSVGIGFAIPSNIVAKVVDQLREHGTVERGWLGVQMEPVTPAIAKALGRPDAKGVIVESVDANSPADRAKLQPGDLITALNGHPVEGAHDLAVTVAEIKPGSDTTLTLWRNGAEHKVAVTLGEFSTEQQSAENSGEQGTKEPVGLALSPLTLDARNQLSVPSSVKGAVVAEVVPGSPAAESGIQTGDVIIKVGEDAVSTPAEAVAGIHAAQDKKKEAVPLLVMREGKAHYLALQLSQA